MQRRTGKGSAHISPPRAGGRALTDSTDMDLEKTSRLNQKTFGVTNRIWIILALFVFIVALTRLILPADPSLPRHGYTDTSRLTPKNYMNNTDTDPNPFEFCPLFGPGDEVGAKHGIHALSKSRIHLGSGARVQRVIHKALSGLPVTISVLGGSVSSCHGAGDDPIAPRCYPSRFFHWWNEVFPHPASELTNGAQRRTNSAYFSFCNAHHLPDDTDLVILEFDSDDPLDDAWIAHYELLVRSILVRPDQPAVVILGHFSPQVIDTYGFHGPEVIHDVVAQFYDVPHISIKPVLFPSYIAKPDTIKPYYADPVLANPLGHELLADVLIHYFQSQICSAWAVATGRAFDVASPLLTEPAQPDSPLMDKHGLFGGLGNRLADGAGGIDSVVKHNLHLRVPLGRVAARPGEQQRSAAEEVAPYCVSANDLINPLPPSLFTGSGWSSVHPPPGSAAVTAYDHYWSSAQPTSRLRVPIQAGAGDVAVYYLKEALSEDDPGSAVQCWVDDNTRGAVLLTNGGNYHEATPLVTVIDHYVTRGSHFVECQLMGEEGQTVTPFRLLGIFAS
ncbi:Cap64 protein [Sanghuangporus baumii]|uniref:Cap64 protein n=1 Tax=Sanghuangporus baumii TaxID=108892 RepID=A0A9Q5HX04_SANBA|nr:Cap64 protein [Sanghuangporus baumii]